jgi:stage II sporulation protein D
MVRVVAAFLTSVAAVAALGPMAGDPSAAAQSPTAQSPTGAPGPGALTGGELTIVPDAGVTLWVGDRAYAGQLTVVPDGGGVDVVNRVDFEKYVEGIGEMPSSWPAAALQAQAVAARTYALWTVLTHHAGPGGGQICATDDCQVYAGLAKAQASGGANWVAAVQATRGSVLQYRGLIIEALYGSSDGGQTVYGGVPWLPSVADPQDRLAPEHQWSWSEPLSAIAAVLGVPAGQTLLSLVSSPTAITETVQGPDRRSAALALSPDQFHSLLNADHPDPPGLDLPLPSYRYSVSTYGPKVTISGVGDGNGLGLSQYGALGKAQAGWTAGQILDRYYHGAVAAPLPAGEMPQTIGVTLASAAPTVRLAADGPARVVDRSGRTVETLTTAGGWTAAPDGAGVALAPVAGWTRPAAQAGGDTVPVTPRGAVTSATGVGPGAPAPTTTMPARLPAPTVAPSPLPVGAPVAAALHPAGSGGSYVVVAALAGGLMAAAIAGGVWMGILRPRARRNRTESTAGP